MKKLTILFYALLFIVVSGISQGSSESEFKEVKTFKWNTADGLPYISDHSGSYSVEVFKPMENQRYAFLSKTKQAILIFNMVTGQKEKTIHLPFFPIDFAYSKNQFFVAGTQNLYVLNSDGKIKYKWFFGDKIRFVNEVKIIDSRLYLISFDNKTWWFDNTRKIFQSHDGVVLKNDVYGKVIKKDKYSFLITIMKKGEESFSKTINQREPLGTIKILGMAGKHLFVEVQTILNEVPLKVKREIKAFTLCNQQINYDYLIPLPHLYYTYVKHDIVVSDNKLDVLISAPERNYLYELKDIDTRILNGKIYLPQKFYQNAYHYNNHLLPIQEDTTNNNSNKRMRAPITRQQIIANGEPYATHQWYCNANNIKDYDCGGAHVTTPSWVTVGNQVSVPYMWGGFSSLSQFDQGLLDGVSAGDSYTVGNGTGPSCAVGVDCSGFVSRAWGLPTKYGTSTLPNISTAYASFDELLPGDIVNYAGHHVRLVHTINGGGSFLLLEASASGTNWRVGYNTYTTADLQGSYIPRYYVDVINDPPDTVNPTTSIVANTWESDDFQVNFTDNDNVALGNRFYQVCYFDGSDWFANNENGFFNDNFSSGISPQWTALSGNWNVNAGALVQSDETSTNTNLYASLAQSGVNTYLYHWKMKIAGSGTNRRAGLFFMVDDPTMTHRHNAYMVYFRVDQNTCQIYKSVNDVIDLKTDDACAVDSNVWFDAKVMYNPNTGEIKVFKDNVLVSSWVDTAPLTGGNSISLRTGEANVSYDDIKVYCSRGASEIVTVGTLSDVPYQNISPQNPACLILSVVTDSSDNVSEIDSAYVNIDWSKPTTVTTVNAGLSADIDTTFDMTQLSANWSTSTDNNSGISAYYYCIGSNPSDSDIVPWMNNNMTTHFTETGLTLNYGTTYYVSIAALNNAGLMSDTTISDGVLLLNPSFISSTENVEKDFLIYPVPAKDKVEVLINNKRITSSPEIFDVYGKKLSNSAIKLSKNLWEFNLKSVANGLYFVRIKEGNNRFTRKLTVMKN